MADIEALVLSLGGMARRPQLLRLGAHDYELTRAVRRGEVVRARNGWYSTFRESDPRLRAVRVGGRLTGLSAIASVGGWVLGQHPLHVSVHRNAARLRTQGNRFRRLNVRAPRNVALHWDDPEVDAFGTSTVVGLVDALTRVVLDEDLETAVAALDWALHTGALDRIDFETLVLRLPVERRGISGWVDPTCESLPESLARTRLRVAGHQVVSQQPLRETQRIDLVVDGQVGIEVDGEEFHLDTFAADRDKDVDIAISGLHNLRPTAKMVFYDWDHFELGVLAALRARGRAPEFSGNARRDVFRSRGLTGWRRRPPHGHPEKSTGRRMNATNSPGSGVPPNHRTRE
jgi:hypothetical protein